MLESNPYTIIIEDEKKIVVRKKDDPAGKSAIPFTDKVIKQFREFLISYLKQGNIKPNDYRKFGKLLWESLNIDDATRDEILKSQNQPLAIWFLKNEKHYLNVPWELLSYGDKPDELKSLQDFSFLYRMIGANNRSIQPVKTSLRRKFKIFVVASVQTKGDRCPEGANQEVVDAMVIREWFEKKLPEQLGMNEIEVAQNFDIRFLINEHQNWLESDPAMGRNPENKYFTREFFTRYLREFRPDVVHFISHGTYKDGIFQIALNNEPDKLCVEWFNAEEFVNFFKDIKDQDQNPWVPTVVFLHACELALNTASTEQDVAMKLSDLGIPVVIAMQLKVNFEASSKFASTFYSRVLNLNEPSSVLLAFYSSKKIVDNDTNLMSKFGEALPVLYLSGDGFLITKLQNTMANSGEPTIGDKKVQHNARPDTTGGVSATQEREEAFVQLMKSMIRNYEGQELVEEISQAVFREIDKSFNEWKKGEDLKKGKQIPLVPIDKFKNNMSIKINQQINKAFEGIEDVEIIKGDIQSVILAKIKSYK